MKQKIWIWLLTAAMLFSFTACDSDALTDALIDVGMEIVSDALTEQNTVGVIGGADGPTSVYVTDTPAENPAPTDAPAYDEPEEVLPAIDEDGTYNSPEDVSLYLYTYDCLPDNYLTKTEANALGWSGGSVERFGDGYAIGGDRFQNRERALPHTDGRLYYECDVNTWGKNERGPERIVWSNDGLIYYTPDHYATFILLYGEE